MAQVQVQPQNAVSGANAAASNGGTNQFVTTSLYVGDLDQNVTDSQLYDLFNQMGQVVSVRVCRDLTSRRSLGYGYVNYNNPQDAARALDVLNFTPLVGRPIRIMYSHRDPSIRKSGTGNIFIKNLDKGIDHKALHDTFSAFGNILSCKVATDSSGQSKGYGFVQFDNEESAQKAIEKLNGMLLNDKQVFVGPFLRKQERESSTDKSKFNNVFVKNLSESTNEEDLNRIFGEFGELTSVVVMRDADGKSRCFGFVNFENVDDAVRAVESLNGKKIDDKEWYVGKAQKKSEREVELKHKFEQSMKEAADKYQGANLYVKNLDDTISDDKLKELFSQYGTITSCKVMRDPNGISRGSGFVAFSTPEEASRALVEMNGKMIVSKPLYVALAQRKEDRRARLQAQFSQMRPVAMAPSVAPRMPMYPPSGPGLGQQIFYGQGPPAIIPSQPGFGYQQQLVPGMRPGGAPMPNELPDLTTIPPTYIITKTPNDQGIILEDPEVKIPIIDFSLLTSGNPDRRSKTITELGKACEEWGFFMVTNHGVPERLMSAVIDGCRGFFDLSEEEKLQFEGKHVLDPIRCGTSFNVSVEKAFYWRDFLKVLVHPQFHFPDKPSGFSYIALEYCKKIREIVKGILEGISESLGLEANYIYKALKLDSSLQIFIANLYPPCPQPELAMGMPTHSDHGLLTFLIQNGISGLQIQHKGKWVNVNPNIPNSFLINTGDHLEILSNGKYKSVLHRVVVNKNNTRISLAIANGPAPDAVVSPASKLVENHAPLYVGLKYKEYVELQQSNNLSRKSILDRVRL